MRALLLPSVIRNQLLHMLLEMNKLVTQIMADAASAISMVTVRRNAERSNNLKEAVVVAKAVAKARAVTQRKSVTDVVNLATSLATAL